MALDCLLVSASLSILDRPDLHVVFLVGVFIFFPVGYKSSTIPQVQEPNQCPTHVPLCREELILWPRS